MRLIINARTTFSKIPSPKGWNFCNASKTWHFLPHLLEWQTNLIFKEGSYNIFQSSLTFQGQVLYIDSSKSQLLYQLSQEELSRRTAGRAYTHPAKQQSSGVGVGRTLAGLVKRRWLGLTSRVTDYLCLQWGWRICQPDKFPGNADAAGLGTAFWEPLPYRFLTTVCLRGTKLFWQMSIIKTEFSWLWRLLYH